MAYNISFMQKSPITVICQSLSYRFQRYSLFMGRSHHFGVVILTNNFTFSSGLLLLDSNCQSIHLRQLFVVAIFNGVH